MLSFVQDNTTGPRAETHGEGGTITPLVDGIAVLQNQRTHREIVKLLKQLERFAADVSATTPAAEERGPVGATE